MKREWSWLSANSHVVGSRAHILRSLLEERYRDIPSVAFSRLVAGQTFFFDETVSQLRSHFSEDRVFCALLYLNRFLLDLPITASVPLHRLEREVYEPRLQVFRQEGLPLEIVEEEPLENSN
jgi:hypothetical protein